MSVLKTLNTWNHQIIEGKANDVRSSLGEARKLLGKPLGETEKQHLRGFVRRAENFLKVKEEEVSSEPLDLQVAKKYVQIRQSALRRNKEFNLTMGDIKRLITRKTCAYTGVRFNNSHPDTKRTFDRVDPCKGYVKGNVVVVTHEANRIKNQLFECHTATTLNFQQLSKMMKALQGKGFQCTVESNTNIIED